MEAEVLEEDDRAVLSGIDSLLGLLSDAVGEELNVLGKELRELGGLSSAR